MGAWVWQGIYTQTCMYARMWVCVYIYFKYAFVQIIIFACHECTYECICKGSRWVGMYSTLQVRIYMYTWFCAYPYTCSNTSVFEKFHICELWGLQQSQHQWSPAEIFHDLSRNSWQHRSNQICVCQSNITVHKKVYLHSLMFLYINKYFDTHAFTWTCMPG